MATQAQETEEVSSITIACTGSSSDVSSGHPKVWLKIPSEKGKITCPYCEKTFILKLKNNPQKII